MSSRRLSIRIDDDTFERLEGESRRSGESRSQLVKTIVDEGLRMRAHPGIVFRPGPAGRRPALADGPDVWTVARVLRAVDAPDGKVIERTVELSGLHPHQVRIAARYYAEYRDEIDEWLRPLDEEADRSYRAWKHEQDVIRS